LEQQSGERRAFRNKERLSQVKEKAKAYCEPWKSAFEWVPEDQPCWYFDLAVWDPSSPEHNWDSRNGRATLAGDAGHPMTYRIYSLELFGSANEFRTWSRTKSLDHRRRQARWFPNFRNEPEIRNRKIRSRDESAS
jgi:hypothetical protein